MLMSTLKLLLPDSRRFWFLLFSALWQIMFDSIFWASVLDSRFVFVVFGLSWSVFVSNVVPFSLLSFTYFWSFKCTCRLGGNHHFKNIVVCVVIHIYIAVSFHYWFKIRSFYVDAQKLTVVFIIFSSLVSSLSCFVFHVIVLFWRRFNINVFLCFFLGDALPSLDWSFSSSHALITV